MYKACSRCGKIHDSRFTCTANKPIKPTTDESNLRSKNQWTLKSLSIRGKANWLCEVCRDKGIYTFDGLEVHHIVKLREKPEKLLDDYNLVCLCMKHHKEADENKIDQDYLLRLARVREEK